MAKKKAKTKKVYVLHSGGTYDVIEETGKYYICPETQFRKSAKRGALHDVEITEKTEPAAAEPAEEPQGDPPVEETEE